MEVMKFIEISQAAHPNGRRPVKVVLHEIHNDDSQYQENGITYIERYVRDNAESVKGMPLCVEFIDSDKDIPHGHGQTGYSKDGMPLFEDSVQVGTALDWSIEDIEIKGVMKRCLCATGYINEARYPHFVDWMFKKIENNETIFGSVEFVGTEENGGEIIYDGGWKPKGRMPMVYNYSGYCFLNVRPADDAAILLELNQAKNDISKEDGNMNEELKNAISEFKSEVISAINENKNMEMNSAVENLEETVESLQAKIEELNSMVESKDAEIASLKECAAQAEEEAQAKINEANCKATEMNEAFENVSKELNELKKANRIAELESVLSKYTDEQKDFAKAEIEAFKADPFNAEIEAIAEKIDAASYRKYRAEEEKKQKELEINSAKSEFDGIMASVDPIVKDDATVEDFDVFA